MPGTPDPALGPAFPFWFRTSFLLLVCLVIGQTTVRTCGHGSPPKPLLKGLVKLIGPPKADAGAECDRLRQLSLFHVEPERAAADSVAFGGLRGSQVRAVRSWD